MHNCARQQEKNKPGGCYYILHKYNETDAQFKCFNRFLIVRFFYCVHVWFELIDKERKMRDMICNFGFMNFSFA